MLYKNNKIGIHNNLADDLRKEGKKHRNKPSNSIISPKLKLAAKNLKNRTDITVRRADKTSSYVILNISDYYEKLDAVLLDNNKFKKMKKDSTNEIKIKANKLIAANNAVNNAHKLCPIVGDFSPGYIYGTVKTHKKNNPIRPIISQIPSPVYHLSKSLNDIFQINIHLNLQLILLTFFKHVKIALVILLLWM